MPTIEVRYEHLNVEAEAHVGSRALPSFLNFTIDILEVWTDGLEITRFGSVEIDLLPAISVQYPSHSPVQYFLLIG